MSLSGRSRLAYRQAQVCIHTAKEMCTCRLDSPICWVTPNPVQAQSFWVTWSNNGFTREDFFLILVIRWFKVVRYLKCKVCWCVSIRVTVQFHWRIESERKVSRECSRLQNCMLRDAAAPVTKFEMFAHWIGFIPNIPTRTTEVYSRNYWVSVIKNQTNSP